VSLDLRRAVESLRGERTAVDHRTANGSWVEVEPDGLGGRVQVATLLLTAAECPWRCSMCDLWKHTLTHPTPQGSIPHQIEAALDGMDSSVRWIKLYNSGSFFDRHSIPPADYRAIARLCEPFERVVVENHPRLSTPKVRMFSQLLTARLEIAMGVETLQTGMLRRLNKGMGRDDIDRAIALHRQSGIDSRAFVLIRPPWTHDDEAARWTTLTLKHVFRLGVRHASLIPVRAGNGWLDRLWTIGEFQPPSVAAVEASMERAFQIPGRGVVTVDLWDWPAAMKRGNSGSSLPAGMDASMCESCVERRGQRLSEMNVTQVRQPTVSCDACGF
jgi:archaeosine synthase beta-subunit